MVRAISDIRASTDSNISTTSNSFDIDFVNTAEAAVRDDDGNLFYHTTLSVPIQLSKPQGVVLQVHGPQLGSGR